MSTYEVMMYLLRIERDKVREVKEALDNLK